MKVRNVRFSFLFVLVVATLLVVACDKIDPYTIPVKEAEWLLPFVQNNQLCAEEGSQQMGATLWTADDFGEIMCECHRVGPEGPLEWRAEFDSIALCYPLLFPLSTAMENAPE